MSDVARASSSGGYFVRHLAIGSLLPVALCPVALGLPAVSGSAVRLKPGQDVAAVVGSSSPGTTFVFSPGIYRLQSIVPKDNDVFIGEGTVVLDGAKLLDMQPDGRLWSVMATIAAGDPRHCGKDHPRCWILNDLFVDDQLQIPVASLTELGPGRWFRDDRSGKIYISTNPSGHRVEFGEAAAAFSGSAAGVRIDHLIVEKYASPPQHGAVGGTNGKAKGWTIQDSEVRWNHGAGMAVGSGSHVERCNIHHNGQLGLAGNGADIEVRNNEFAFNNYAGFETGWDAGGAKFSVTNNLVLRSNYAHDNFGDGLWVDIDNTHALYERNKVINNRGIGIHHEISYDAIIRNNLVKGNREGILVVLSPNVEVYGNFVEVPPQGVYGIRIATGSRGGGSYGTYAAHDDYVHDNIVTYLGPASRSGPSGPLVEGANIRFDSNEYHCPAGGDAHWIRGSESLTLSGIARMGMERHSTVKRNPPPETDPTQ